MQAFLTILKYDFGQLSQSWVSRIWIIVMTIPAIFLIFLANYENEFASETMAFYTATVLMPASGLAIAVLSASSINGESGIIADSILSRAITRTEYVCAKILSRMGFILVSYSVVIIPFSYFMLRYGVDDTVDSSVFLGWIIIGSILTAVAAFGILTSVLIANLLPAVLLVLLTVSLSSALMQFLGLELLSISAVIQQLPEIFRGETFTSDGIQIIITFLLLTSILLFPAIFIFGKKDL